MQDVFQTPPTGLSNPTYFQNIKPQTATENILSYYHIYDMKLGEGGFAKVRLASHLVTKHLVAVKCLDKIKLGNELPRVYNEIKCLKKLRHQYIARLLQVFESDTHIFIVLEHCSGGELFDYIIKKTKLEEPESAQIIHDLMKVLDFIHTNGFAHRDLKPENILFDDKYRIRLIDFGLAANCCTEELLENKGQPKLDQLKTCCGSVTYAAPELISGQVYSGPAVDVWSSGVMLFAMLCGRVPFNDTNVSILYQQIRRGVKQLPEYLTADARDLLSRMLDTNPKTRITVKEILSHSWLRNRVNTFAKIIRRPEYHCGQIEESIFAKCCEKFPNIQPDKLREFILQDFNYFSATYWLLQTKCPPRTPALARTTLGPRQAQQQQLAPHNIHHIPPPQIATARTQQTVLTPTKRPNRFATVRHSPINPRLPKSHAINIMMQKEKENNLMSPFTPNKTAKKSIVRRLLRF